MHKCFPLCSACSEHLRQVGTSQHGHVLCHPSGFRRKIQGCPLALDNLPPISLQPICP